MGNRTVEWHEAIKSEVTRDGGMTHAYDIEPGDGTRYLMTITAINGDITELVHENGYVVTVYNLRGWPVSMFVRKRELIDWQDVRDLLGISAEGSCWMITHILEHLVATRADTYAEFQSKYRAWLKVQDEKRSSTHKRGGK